MSKATFNAIVLAGGQGTRMQSPLPKVLHPVAGIPMLVYGVMAAKAAGAKMVRVVVGYGSELVETVAQQLDCVTYKQKHQFGTADAVRSAKPEEMEGDVLILNGDHPLIMTDDLRKFHQEFIVSKAALAVYSARLKNPKDFGRIVRLKGALQAIVEAKDASAETLKINEVNTGIYFIKADVLKKYLPKIKNQNAKQEFYFTDILSLCVAAGEKVIASEGSTRAAHGVNTQQELALATKIVFHRKIKKLLTSGAIVIDPENTYIEASVEIGSGTIIYPGVYLRGNTKIGMYCVIEPNVFAMNAVVGESTQIRAGSYLENCKVGKKCILGPYARLRPETEIAEEVHIGNFVELKKVKMGARSKANHLTYLGDAEIGQDVNVGCGTITCNYAVDRQKYKTIIGNNVFVGSDSQLVAPVKIGDGAVIGSGSTITKDVPAGALAVTRAPQLIKENYKPKSKK